MIVVLFGCRKFTIQLSQGLYKEHCQPLPVDTAVYDRRLSEDGVAKLRAASRDSREAAVSDSSSGKVTKNRRYMYCNERSRSSPAVVPKAPSRAASAVSPAAPSPFNPLQGSTRASSIDFSTSSTSIIPRSPTISSSLRTTRTTSTTQPSSTPRAWKAPIQGRLRHIPRGCRLAAAKLLGRQRALVACGGHPEVPARLILNSFEIPSSIDDNPCVNSTTTAVASLWKSERFWCHRPTASQ